MFGLSKLKRRVADLERRLFITMSEECRQNRHTFFIVKEWKNSDYCGGMSDVWSERTVECSRCGYRTGDSNMLGGWRHKTIAGSFEGIAPDNTQQLH